MRQILQHDPASPRCGCVSCANARLVAEHKAALAAQREQARINTQDYYVSIVTMAKGQEIIYQFEIGADWWSGTFREFMTFDLGEHQFLADVFNLLAKAQQLDVLKAARKRKRVRIGDLWVLWDEEQAEELAAEERLRKRREGKR